MESVGEVAGFTIEPFCALEKVMTRGKYASKPSDKFQKEDHPYDRGYWARYDGEGRFAATEGSQSDRGDWRNGWWACDRDLAVEA